MFCNEFISPSAIHESLFVGYLWKNPKLYKQYKDFDITQYSKNNNNGTITTPIWYFYYKLGETMIENGIKNFNDTTVYSFLSSQPEIDGKSWINDYEIYGGFRTIKSVVDECEDKSNDKYHFSEIQKYELLRYYENNGLLNPELEVKKKGKPILIKDLMCKMTLDKIKSYFQYYMKRGNSTVGNSNIKVTNLTDGLNESIEEFNKGVSMGIELYKSPRLNNIIKGWQRGNFLFLVLASGVGKSTFSNAKFDLGIYASNEKCIHYVNEENKRRMHHTLISTVSSSVLNSPITRDRLSEGFFTEEENIRINKAKDWLKSKPVNQIKVGEIEKFFLSDVIDSIEMYKSLGYNYMILDTFKPDSSKAEVARWEKFSQHSQDIFDCIKPSVNNIGALATLQLKIGEEHKYLDLDCIGKAKEPVEVADIVLMGRLLFEDEYEKLVVYDYVSGDMGYTRKEILLNKEKEYMILFIPKNRNGGKSQQVIYEVDYDTNNWIEIGYTNMKKSARK